MNELTERRQQVLSRGLAAFDAAVARRSRVRRAARLAVAVAVLLAAGLAVTWAVRPARPVLPAYVELITDDPQLASELALAHACERFERTQGRLVVVECAAHGPGLR